MTYLMVYKMLIRATMLVAGVNIVTLAMRRPNNEVKFLLCLSFAVIGYLSGYYFFVDGGGEDMIVTGIKLMYVGTIVIVMVTLKILEQVFNIHLLRRVWGLLALWMFFLAAGVTFFDHYSFLDISHWMYRYYTFSYNSREMRYIIQMEYGWLAHAFNITIILYFFFTVGLYLYRLQHSRKNHRRNYTLYFLVILIPEIVFLMTRRFHLNQSSFPYFPIVLVVFLSLATVLVLLQKFASLYDMALKKVGDVVESPMFVIDDLLRVYDVNRPAVDLYPEYRSTLGMMGKPKKANGVLQNIISPLYEAEGEGEKNLVTIEGNVYSPECHKILANDTLYGYVILLRDVTAQQDMYTRLQDRNAKLQQLVHYYEDEIAIIHGKFVSGIIQIILGVDKNTGEHMRRTSNYTYVIAKQLQREGKFADTLSDQYVEVLSKVAPLHDVGKLNLSKELLAKQGGFTKPQMEEHQRHVSYGVDLIDSLIIANPDDLFYQLSHDVAMYHHEWWDGEGYPKGLRGGEIPLSARIVAVADAFDTISAQHSYVSNHNFDETFYGVISYGGRRFDPDVIEAFKNARNKIKDLFDQMLFVNVDTGGGRLIPIA